MTVLILNQPPNTKSVSKEEQRMLNAYDVLMNDLTLVKGGNFGGTPIPTNPTYYLHRSEGRKEGMPGNNPAMETISRLRREFGRADLAVGDGLISIDPNRKGLGQPSGMRWGVPAVDETARGGILFWLGTTGESDPAHRLRGWNTLERTAKEVRSAILANPDRDFVTSLGSSILTARAIRYRNRECISCHAGAKVGDLAAIATVVLRRANGRYDIGKPVTLAPTEDPNEEVGFKVYARAKLKPNTRWLRDYGGIRKLGGEWTSPDPVQPIFDHYLQELKSLPDPAVRVLERGPRSAWLDYEFGPDRFGQIWIATVGEVTNVRIEACKLRAR